MQYELVKYDTYEEFNEDAEMRSQKMIKDRSILTYDRPWIVDQWCVHVDQAVTVMWRRMEREKRK